MPKLDDTWTSANAYDLFMGRWSRLIAYEFLEWLGVASNRRWLEMGCGAGALTNVILERGDPAESLALDPSEELFALARDNVLDMRVQFAKGRAADFPTPGHPIDVFTSGLVLNFVPQPEAAIRYAIEQMAPGGLISAYMWDYSDGMEFLRVFWDAAIEIDPAAVDLDEGVRFPLCRPEALDMVFRSAGLQSIVTSSVSIETSFSSFADYWDPFLGGTGPSPAFVQSLDTDERRRLEDALKARLLPEGESGFQLMARAWMVKGLDGG